MNLSLSLVELSSLSLCMTNSKQGEPCFYVIGRTDNNRLVLSVVPPVCLPFHPVCLSVHPVCLSVVSSCLSAHPVCLPVCHSTCLSAVSSCLSVIPPVCLPLHPVCLSVWSFFRSNRSGSLSILISQTFSPTAGAQVPARCIVGMSVIVIVVLTVVD